MHCLLAALLLLLLPLTSFSAAFPPVLDSPNSFDPHSRAGVDKLAIAISEKLLGRPYVGGNLGEGTEGIYDTDPLYRLDVFDCTTFIETVMSNIFCNDERNEACLSAFMQKIRYFGDSISFETRNHIAETDWIRSNVRRGFVRDITQDFGGTATRFSRVRTDKKSWFESRTLADIQTHDSAFVKAQKVAVLQKLGAGLALEDITVPYLGFDLLYLPGFTVSTYQPNEELLKRLPNGAIFNVVREDWAPPGEGTPLAISHQGFIVQKSDGTYLRHASTNKAVIDVKLADYMIQFIDSPTIRGLNVLQIQPKP
ncbi:MAG: N-acetylmuramoyl-L-alanine amidase-like domain-containing protein [Bdellovibrionota bacterium]